MFPLLLAAESPHEVEHRLLIVLVQLVVIILSARLFATVFRWLKQPTAVGELAAGLVLGPSVFGYFWPELSAMIFPPATTPHGQQAGLILSVISQLGLVFLLFLIGLEFDFSHLKTHSRAAMLISLMGIALPFALGWGVAHWMHPYLGEKIELGGFSLFMGTAMSITALPMLARMMQEWQITRTRLGAITITASAVDDAAGWILLAAVSAIVRANFELAASLIMVAETVGFALAMIFIVRPILRRWIRFALRRGDGQLGLNSLAILLVVLFLCSVATNVIGIFAIFGAFLLGAVLSDEHDFRVAVSRQLRNFVTVFFLPIFFTYTGLRTNIGTLESATLWLFAAAVSATAILGKFGGCSLAARLGGFSNREAICVGAMMNTRGLMELIVINVGHDLGVIPQSVYCMLVMMALLTTVMTTPLLLLFMKGTELEPHLRKSGFVTDLPEEEVEAEGTAVR